MTFDKNNYFELLERDKRFNNQGKRFKKVKLIN